MQKFIMHSPTTPRVTIVGLVDEQKVAHIGVARCSSSQPFCKKKGVLIATQRAKQKPLATLENVDSTLFQSEAKRIAIEIASHPEQINGRLYKQPRKR